MRDARFLAGGLRMLLAVVMLEGLARPAAAQVFELGGGVSRERILQRPDRTDVGAARRDLAVAAVADQPAARDPAAAGFQLFDTSGRALQPRDGSGPACRSRIDITTRESSRQLAGGEAIYHFARAGRLGAVLGVGIGQVRNLTTLSCEPAGCEDVLRVLGQATGRLRPRGISNLTVIAGLSGHAWTRGQISGGVRLHNFAGENLSTAEAFLTTGIRFGSF